MSSSTNSNLPNSVTSDNVKEPQEPTADLQLSAGHHPFPPPQNIVAPAGINAANRFDELMKSWCSTNNSGATSFADGLGYDSPEPIFEESRQLLSIIDSAVARAFGFEAAVPQRGVQVAPYIAGGSSLAYVLPLEGRAEVLDFLITLNCTRYESENS